MAGDKIDGNTGSMGNYDSAKNLKDFKPDKGIKSSMDEGQSFNAKDGEAIGLLTDFVMEMGIQLRSATNTARADEREYIGADKNASDKLLEIAFQPSTLSSKQPDA